MIDDILHLWHFNYQIYHKIDYTMKDSWIFFELAFSVADNCSIIYDIIDLNGTIESKGEETKIQKAHL